MSHPGATRRADSARGKRSTLVVRSPIRNPTFQIGDRMLPIRGVDFLNLCRKHHFNPPSPRALSSTAISVLSGYTSSYSQATGSIDQPKARWDYYDRSVLELRPTFL
jgi:hypothetical protein